jgi:hypothetical protein
VDTSAHVGGGGGGGHTIIRDMGVFSSYFPIATKHVQNIGETIINSGFRQTKSVNVVFVSVEAHNINIENLPLFSLL